MKVLKNSAGIRSKKLNPREKLHERQVLDKTTETQNIKIGPNKTRVVLET